MITWPWVWQDPAQPGQYAVWTVEDGSRIRFARFDTASLPQPINGWSWVNPTAPANAFLRSISIAADGGAGLAVGANATWLWATSSVFGGPNGGGVWRPSTLNLPDTFPPDVQLWHVTQDHFNPNIAWVVGDSGLLARTTAAVGLIVTLEACEFVQPIAPLQPLPIGGLTGIEFMSDMSNGVAVGELTSTLVTEPSGQTHRVAQGGIYHTTDGTHWEQAKMTFLDPDGVETNAPASTHFWKVSFVPNSPIGFAVGGSESSTGYLMATDDGGVSWRQEHHECAEILSNCPSLANCSIPQSACVQQPTSTARGYANMLSQYGITASANGGAIAVGYGSQILLRNPAPTSLRCWTDVSNVCDFSTAPMWGVHQSPDGALVVATGAPGQLRTSADHGLTWSNQGTEGAWRQHDLAVVSTGGQSNNEVIWTCGQMSRITVSYDRGVTYSIQRAETFVPKKAQNLRAIAVRDDGDGNLLNDVGVAVGAPWKLGAAFQWTLLHTSSGGELTPTNACGWSETTVVNGVGAAPAELLAATYAGQTSLGQPSFWCAGANNTVLRSLDGGATWNVEKPCDDPNPAVCADPTPADTKWTAVAFGTVDDGWLSGSTSGGATPVVFRTTNGAASSGVLWTRVTPAPSKPLLDIASKHGETIGIDRDGGVHRWNPTTGAFELLPASGLTDCDHARLEIASDTLGGVHVYVACDSGQMRRYDFSSATWTIVRSPTSFTPGGLAFLSAELGYALFDQVSAPSEGGSSRALLRIE